MKKIVLTFVVLCVLALAKGYSQSYKGGIGLRLGRPSGITGKTFLNKNAALEGIFHYWKGGFGLTGLYEIHSQLGRDKNLQFYYGAGAGFTVQDHYHNDYFSLGIDGVIGIEYKIKSAPISLGLDIKPYLNVIPEIGISETNVDAALSVRYTF